MYKLYVLLCLLSTATFANSNETKYIDLLPESEKQEFLNRIARRILQEIESRDSPEQPHAEITDDQLDAHNTYVQGLIKEETEVHKNERRDFSSKEPEGDENNKGDLSNDPLEVQDTAKVDGSGTENQHHIDLTRNEKRYSNSDSREIQNKDKNDDSILNDLPVKVIYDDRSDVVKGFRNNSDIYYINKEVIPSNNYEQKHNLFDTGSDPGHSISNTDRTISENKEHISNNTNKYNPNNGDEMSIEKYIAPHKLTTNFSLFESEKDKDTAESIKKEDTDNDSIVKIQEELHDQKSSINITSLQNKKEKEGLQAESGPLLTDISDEMVLPDKRENGQNRFQKISSATMTNINSHNKLPLLPQTAKVDNVIVSVSPASVEPNAKKSGDSKLNSREVLNKSDKRPSSINVPTEKLFQKHTTAGVEQGASPIIYLNTEKKRKSKKNEYENGERKFNKNYIYQSLHIAEDYGHNIVEPDSSENFNFRNNKANEYLVYEVPKDRPSFTKKPLSPIVESREDIQPQYIPIYNFDPKNVYYNPYNRFGPNNNDNVKAIERTSFNNKEDELDRDLYLHSGFHIDLKPTSHTVVNLNTKKGQHNRYTPAKSGQSAKANELVQSKINMMYEPNLDMDYVYDTLRQNGDDNYASVQNFLRNRSQPQIGKYDTQHFDDMDYYLNYWSNNDLRRRRKGQKNISKSHFRPKGKILPNSNERDHPLHSMHKDNVDYMRAVQKVLYRQKQFGCLSPPPHKPDMTPRRKRFCDETSVLDSNDIRATKKIKNNAIKKSHTKHIAKDYYWGEFNPKRKDYDYDDVLLNNRDTNEREGRQMKLLRDTHDGDDFGVSLDSLLDVLHDMIERDNRGLALYDWLSSTVDIEAALMKLLELAEKSQNGNYIHPLDLKLLNFVLYLYDSSTKITNSNQSRDNLKASLSTDDILNNLIRILRMTLPKNKHKKPGEKIKNPLNMWRAWYKYYIRVLNDENNKNAKIIKSFKSFLKTLQENLYDLHNTIKDIAHITTASNQNWYNDLKRIFFKSASRRQLLQVILHLSTSKLYKNLESSAKKSKGDYSNYVKNNSEEVKRLREEFVLILKILDRLEYGKSR